MSIACLLESLISYAMNRGLAEPEDHQVLLNRLLEILQIPEYTPSQQVQSEDLEQILTGILDYACQKGLCENHVTARDLFDTRIMGALTPMPREVRRTFREKYALSPEAATDWYYRFSGDTDYIRRYRVCKDLRWKYHSAYGVLDVTINLSKPEKDPKAIAAEKNAPKALYPKCLLCPENEGYAGRMNHPARQSHRILPLTLGGESWYMQYSPYVYYNEHCIAFNASHVPMRIDRAAFQKLLDFVTVFPHYFIGSNADLPIVGGSILSHEHFQGGHYTFAMEAAPDRMTVDFTGFADVSASIVDWPMSALRLRCANRERLLELADKVLRTWRQHTDEACCIFAETEGQPHNTITPIARRRGTDYEMDLVLRCNITTAQHPAGLFHPHADKHHIKRENIGLIEVMGLAVLPGRLKAALTALADAIVEGRDVSADPILEKHADWVRRLQQQRQFTAENAMGILLEETGRVFAAVLEDAGVYKDTPEGNVGFLRFVEAVNRA